MHRWIGGVLAVLLCLGGVSPLGAQATDDATRPNVDPPDTEYQAGARDPDPAVERRLPVVPAYKGFLPVAADLSTKMPPVGNQQGSASSAAWAAAYAARGYYAGTIEGRDVSQPANLPSPAYVYHQARQGGCEEGTNIPRVVDVLRRGAPTLADQPFRPDCVAPGSPVATGHDFRVQGLRRIELKRIDDIKGELHRANPVIVEFRVSPAFRRLRGAATFSEPDFAAAGNADIRQFLTLVGYDERRQAFRLVNSWGTGWGDRGYAWLGYDDVKARVVRAYVVDVAAAAPGRRKLLSAPAGAAKAQPPAKPDLTALEQLACGKVGTRTEGERRVLSGFVATDGDLKLIGAVAAGSPDLALGEIEVVPWPLCEALQTLDQALGAPEPPRISVNAAALREGDNLTIEAQSSGEPRHLYVSYVQADGSVLNLAQPAADAGEATVRASVLKFGDGKDNRPRFLIGPPFGREMIITLASPRPLFGEALPKKQAARDYLTMLRRALMVPRSPGDPEPKVAAAVKLLKTQGR